MDLIDLQQIFREMTQPLTEAIAASKQSWRSTLTSDLKSVTSISYVHTAYTVWTVLVASEATKASKQPQRPDLTSHLNYTAQFTFAHMFV